MKRPYCWFKHCQRAFLISSPVTHTYPLHMIAIMLNIKCCGVVHHFTLKCQPIPSPAAHATVEIIACAVWSCWSQRKEHSLHRPNRIVFSIITLLRRLLYCANPMLLPVVCHVSCGLRQRHYRIIRCTCAGFTKATCPLLPTNESTISYAASDAPTLPVLKYSHW